MDTAPTIAIIDGTPCVKEGYALSDEPVIIYNHWPIGHGAGYAVDHEGETLQKNNCNYSYKLRTAPFTYKDIVLTEMGRTKAIHREEVEIPKPKTRVKTRYRHGRWEKYLKAKGWVAA